MKLSDKLKLVGQFAKMNCHYTEQISSLIDGELSQVEARQLERHLLSCVACQEAKSDFLNLRTQIIDFPVSSRPEAQRKALERIVGKQRSDQTIGVGWRWVFNPAVAVVASLLLVGAVITLLLYPKAKPGPAPSDTEIAKTEKGRRKPRPTPAPSVESGQKDRGQNNTAPKNSAPPANKDKSKTPIRKRVPLIIEPSQDNIARALPEDEDDLNTATTVRSADSETMTAIHLQKSELLLRSFRNVRLNEGRNSAELGYEKNLAQKLVYQNMVLRREADAAGDTQVASLLENLEPILLDIANLPDKPRKDSIREIKARVERKNIVALLQVNSAVLARALD